METRTIKVYSNYGGAFRVYFCEEEFDHPIAEIYTLENGGYLVLTDNPRGGYNRKYFPKGYGYQASRRAEFGCSEVLPFKKLNFVNQ